MNRRPMPIVLLAIFQALTPVFNLAVNSIAFNIGPARLLQDLITRQPLHVTLEFLVLGPVAAICIYIFRRWSYALFLACMGWGVTTNILTWMANPNLISLPLLLGVSLLSCLLVTYFMLPAVRAAYWNPSLRWWESRPRFRAEGEVSFTKRGGQTFRGKYRNVSEGGLFVETEPTFQAEDRAHAAFTIAGEAFDVEARFAFASATLRGGYGLQLIADPATRKRLRRAVHALESQGAIRISPKPRFVDDFRAWVKELRTTGHGLLPELNPIAKARLAGGSNAPEQQRKVG